MSACPRCRRLNCSTYQEQIGNMRRVVKESDRIACHAIAEVWKLERFDGVAFGAVGSDSYLRRPSLHDNIPDVLSVRTIALLRAYRRLTNHSLRGGPIVDRYRAADDIAAELVHYLSIDLDVALGSGPKADRALDDAIGDLCPACREPMSVEDGPALRDDYRCGKCLKKGETTP